MRHLALAASIGGQGRRVAPALADAEADWIARSTAAGVTYLQDFRNEAAVTPYFFDNGAGEVAAGYISVDATDGFGSGKCLKLLTPAGYTGTASHAFRHPLNSSWTLNSQSFGTTPLYIFWRMKINAGRLSRVIAGNGWKFVNIAQFSVSDGGSTGVSNTLAEIVGQDTFHRGFPQAYHRNQAGNFPDFGWETFGGSGDFKMANMVDNGVGLPNNERYCLYQSLPSAPGCWHWVTDEWMCFQMRIKYGTYNGTTNNEFDFWAARQNATAWTHLISETGFDLGGFQGTGGYTGSNGAHWHVYETSGAACVTDSIVKISQILVGTNMHALPTVGA